MGHRQHNHSIERIYDFVFKYNRNYEAMAMAIDYRTVFEILSHIVQK